MFPKCSRLLPVARRIQFSAVERSHKGCTSALFVPRDLQSESFVVIHPHLDFNERFQDLETLQRNVSQRGMGMDVLALKKSWDKLQEVEKYKMSLEKKLAENVALSKFCDRTENKQHGQLQKDRVNIKKHIKSVNQEICNLEKTAIIGALSLPNAIHPDTPVEDEKMLHEFGPKPENPVNHTHVEIAEQLNLAEFYDSSFYFLKGDAAKFELGISFLFLDSFRDEGFIWMSNSDFGRSVAVEGVGMDPTDSNSVFMLQKEADQTDPNVRLHLVGGASLVSFSIYHAKTVTLNKDLPLRYVTMGKHYSPGNSAGLHGLFSSWQNSAVEAFVATSDKDQAMSEFQNMVKKLISLYECLGYHFRAVYVPPTSLKPWESLHASFQMFAPNMGCYIEVANVCLCDDYVSKRMLICCTENTQRPRQFAHVVSSTLVSVPRVLGCVLENNVDRFVVPPEVLKKVT